MSWIVGWMNSTALFWEDQLPKVADQGTLIMCDVFFAKYIQILLLPVRTPQKKMGKQIIGIAGLRVAKP